MTWEEVEAWWECAIELVKSIDVSPAGMTLVPAKGKRAELIAMLMAMLPEAQIVIADEQD